MNMQDPTVYHQPMNPQFPEQEQHLKCPRCDSNNTKFCYYNNYNLSQPRHFCKNCRRYWTKGGALRNIPVGGGSRKNTKKSSSSNPKRHSSLSSNSSTTTATATNSPTSLMNAQNSVPKPEPRSVYGGQVMGSVDQDRRMLDMSGSFSSLLASSGQFGALLENLNPNGSGLRTLQFGGFSENLNSENGLDSDMGRRQGLDLQSGNNSQNFLGVQSGDSNCWSGGGGGGGSSNGWPDLAIYTPGSTFQ